MPLPSPTRRRILMAPILLLAMLPVGCGGQSEVELSAEDNPSFGPGGGPLSTLPGGTFEVTTESSGSGIRLVATFFATEAADAPLSPAPTDVSIDLELPDGSTVNVPLSPASGDEARFTSEPGDYEVDPLFGTLNATVDGTPASVEFSGVRY